MLFLFVSFSESSYVITIKAGNPKTRWQWIKLQLKSLWLRIKTSLLVLHKREGAVENPWSSLGVSASWLSDVTFESCHVEYLTVTLTPPSCSRSTPARYSTFPSGKHHKSIASIKIGWIQKSKWTACQVHCRSLSSQTKKIFFWIIKEIKLSELCQIYSLLTCINKEYFKAWFLIYDLKKPKKTTHTTFQLIFHACSRWCWVPSVHTAWELQGGNMGQGHCQWPWKSIVWLQPLTKWQHKNTSIFLSAWLAFCHGQ